MFYFACLSLVFNIIQIWILHTGEGGHVHIGGQKCNHDHGSGDHHHDHDHAHDHGHHHDHGHGHEHKHDHGHGHEHGHSCKHDHGKEIVQEHKHGAACNHTTSAEDSHEHKHSHSHGEEIASDDELMTDDQKKATEKQKKVRNLNVEAAYLHVLGDMLNSIGVIISATIIYIWPQYWFMDPICTYFFALIVLVTTQMPFWGAVKLLLETAPEHIDQQALEKTLLGINGVDEVHDLHVWQLTHEKICMTVHLFLNESHALKQ